MLEKISTGTSALDELLDNGYEKGAITTIYGAAGSGKTNLCMLTAIRTAGRGHKIIYIDTERKFSVERLHQITNYGRKVLQNTLFFHPATLDEQTSMITSLEKILRANIGLIIVDSLTALYRMELSRDSRRANALLRKQSAMLTRYARVYDIPVVITTQVYADMNNNNMVTLVGGNTLKKASWCILQLENSDGLRKIILRKHRTLPEKSVEFKINEKGIS
ncbi:MAG TPA: DNA repair and recombination protein RadB [Candidatus Nanoarchaeia archaeon]|nr:DNA repair and recombination protein RadB [Candidatus Nanoarchaeia archaeon]